MTVGIITAVVSAVTSLVVALGTQFFSVRATRQLEQAKERDRINLTYLNPLRLYLEEVYARLSRIRARLADERGICQALLTLKQPEDLTTLPAEWFTDEGYYLISTCYLTACLFFQMDQVRDHVPFLQLSKASDTELVNHLAEVSLSLGKTGGIFYVLQASIAEDIAAADGQKPISYRSFCEKLKDPTELAWFRQLVQFYLEMGMGKKSDRLERILSSISAFLQFLEGTLAGKASIEGRIKHQLAHREASR